MKPKRQLMANDVQEISHIAEQHITQWPYFGAGDYWHVIEHQGKVAIEYRNEIRRYDATTLVSMEISGDFLYLLYIELKRSLRGQGFGEMLYKMAESIAADCGSREIRQTPSGWTPSNDSRRNYLNRRGWLDDGLVVFKTLG